MAETKASPPGPSPPSYTPSYATLLIAWRSTQTALTNLSYTIVDHNLERCRNFSVSLQASDQASRHLVLSHVLTEITGLFIAQQSRLADHRRTIEKMAEEQLWALEKAEARIKELELELETNVHDKTIEDVLGMMEEHIADDECRLREKTKWVKRFGDQLTIGKAKM